VRNCRATGWSSSPLAIGAIVVVVNLDGVATGELRLTGPLLADIYLGKVTRWNAGDRVGQSRVQAAGP
jgi:phosphate transport system substrate-binding protein